MFKRTLLAASLGLAALASAQAMAVTGGGASLPADLYKGSADSILPSNFSYAVTGSGTGKSAFLTNTASQFGTTGTVHFAGSDSVLSSADMATYNPTVYGPLIQVPSVATSVTVPYKKTGNTTLNLTTQQLCDAFSGAKATWGELLNNNAASDPTLIRIVYRSGSSGTSELLTRHLNSICPSQFGVSSTFTSARLGGNPVPSHWTAVALTENVVGAVNDVDGSIGYVSPDVVDINSNAQVAQVNGKLPTVVNVNAALGSATVPADAVKNDPTRWVPVFTNPSAGYPIVGYTNFIFGQCYKDAAVAADVRAFITKHWGGTSTNLAVANHGFIPVNPTWKTAIQNTFVNNTSGLNLDINNVNVCNATVGR